MDKSKIIALCAAGAAVAVFVASRKKAQGAQILTAPGVYPASTGAAPATTTTRTTTSSVANPWAALTSVDFLLQNAMTVAQRQRDSRSAEENAARDKLAKAEADARSSGAFTMTGQRRYMTDAEVAAKKALERTQLESRANQNASAYESLYANQRARLIAEGQPVINIDPKRSVDQLLADLKANRSEYYLWNLAVQREAKAVAGGYFYGDAKLKEARAYVAKYGPIIAAIRARLIDLGVMPPAA